MVVTQVELPIHATEQGFGWRAEAPKPNSFNVQIIGNGPAAIGPIIAAANHNLADSLFDRGILVVGKSGSKIGRGTIGDFGITSNSARQDFEEDPYIFGGLSLSDAALALRAYEVGEGVPLPTAGDYLGYKGRIVRALLNGHPFCDQRQSTVGRIVYDDDGRFISYDTHGFQIAISSKLVEATGAREQRHPDLIPFEDKLFDSSAVLTGNVLGEVYQKLKKGVKVISIVGGAHSAFSSADLIDRTFRNLFPDLQINIFYRTQPKLYFASTAEADSYGYPYNVEDLSEGKVNRFDGVRGKHLREIALGYKYPAINLVQYDGKIDTIRDALMASAAIIQATGYIANRVPITDVNGVDIGPQTNRQGHVIVSENAQLFFNDGTPIPGAYGNGHGFAINGRVGVNLFQGNQGLLVAQGILAE